MLIVYSFSAIIAALAGLSGFIHYLISRNTFGNPLLFFYKAEATLLFFPRIKSFFYTPNMFVTFAHIGLVTIACLYFLLNKKSNTKVLKILLFASSIIISVAVFLAGSQCLSGVLLTIFMLLFLFKGRTAAVLRYVVFIVTFLVMIFAVFTTIWMIYPLEVNNDFSNKFVDVRVNYAYSHHIIPSIYGFLMFQEHPFLGVGIGTFTALYPKYIKDEIEFFSSSRLQVSPDRILDPHNTYTGMLTEGGVFGFLAMIALLFAFIKMLLPHGEKNDSPVSSCLLAGLLGYLFNAFFIDVMTMRHFWIFLAFIFIFYKKRKEISYEANT